MRKCHRNRPRKKLAARMWLNGHGQPSTAEARSRQKGAGSKSPITSPLFGTSRFSETGVIQERGLHERDASFQFFFFFSLQLK